MYATRKARRVRSFLKRQSSSSRTLHPQFQEEADHGRLVPALYLFILLGGFQLFKIIRKYFANYILVIEEFNGFLIGHPFRWASKYVDPALEALQTATEPVKEERANADPMGVVVGHFRFWPKSKAMGNCHVD